MLIVLVMCTEHHGRSNADVESAVAMRERNVWGILDRRRPGNSLPLFFVALQRSCAAFECEEGFLRSSTPADAFVSSNQQCRVCMIEKLDKKTNARGKSIWEKEALAAGGAVDDDVGKSTPYSSLLFFSPPRPQTSTATASPSATQARRALLTFGIGPAFPGGVGAATATPAPAASAPPGGGNNGVTTATKLRACAGPFEICPAPALCRNPNKGNEWCYWLYVDKASCVCL